MSINPKPVTGKLGKLQQLAVDGPDVPMVTFICSGCNRQYMDTRHYFYGEVSTRCLWCIKFPQKKSTKLKKD